ncbi:MULTISPECIES: lipase family protein [Amycolatopsis]|uniref:lipase family protein n=1 Tax=Amycolatopsis TaxID=1813 RepID=UPI000B8B5501|nr:MULTISPECIES: lipase family protein [Amycolatopsis]OXM70169.1 lipase [Amycolatopsis sp. KNN50.9b]
MRLSTRRLAAIVTAAVAALSVTTAPAGAATSSGDFYDPPATLPSDNGAIIRHEPSQFFLDPVKLLRAPAAVQRIMYRSTDTHGDAVAVTGTVLTPKTPWRGAGERPLIAYAPGTQGLGDQCAPSKALAAGGEYEGPFIAGLLARGYAVVVTDYQGLGTPGVHTYVNRKAEAHAVLDSIRATQRLPGLPADGPVAIAGYSQGGGASAAAAELQPSYAPELDLEGAYAGAVPADLVAVGRSLDGAYAVGFLMFAVASVNYAYPELRITDVLNDRGKALVARVERECTVESIVDHAFTRTADLTVDGRSISEYLAEEPYASVVEEQRIGRLAPAVPMYVVHSALDDIVPYQQGRTMARTWCDEGATVRFDTLAVPTHVGGAVAGYPAAFAWLEGRFAGEAAPDNCGEF